MTTTPPQDPLAEVENAWQAVHAVELAHASFHRRPSAQTAASLEKALKEWRTVSKTPDDVEEERVETSRRLRALADEHGEHSHYFMSYDADFLRETADRIHPASS